MPLVIVVVALAAVAVTANLADSASASPLTVGAAALVVGGVILYVAAKKFSAA